MKLPRHHRQKSLSLKEQYKEEKRLRAQLIRSLISTAGATALFTYFWWPLGIMAFVVGGLFSLSSFFEWFSFRAKWGMRF